MKFLPKLILLFCISIGAERGGADDVPVAPISATRLAKWGPVYEISTKKIRIIVSPEAGGVVSMRNSGEEEYLLSPLLIQALPLGDEKQTWESRAWRTSEGKQVVMLHRNLGAPYYLRVVHVIELNAAGDQLRQTTRMTGLAPEAIGFLNPSVETHLTLPDSQLQKESGALELVYGQTLNRWFFDWEIELPEDTLAHEVQLHESDAQLSLTSRPLDVWELPPQGWTLLCTMEIIWTPQLPPASNDHLKN